METGYLEDGTFVRIYDDLIYVGNHEIIERVEIQDFDRTKEIFRELIEKERATQKNNSQLNY